jgi:rubredoxin
MEHFFNEGFGWTCRRCHAETKARESQPDSRARFFTEGEAEDSDPRLSAPALARWRDSSRQALICPMCGVEETLD